MAVLKSPLSDGEENFSNKQNFGGFILDHLRRNSNSKWINGTSHEAKTYGDVAEETVAVHAALGSLGIGAGHKILLLLNNRSEVLPVVLGAACANVAFVYNYPGFPADFLIDFMKGLDCDAIFCEYEDVGEVLKVPSSLPTVKHIIVFGEPSKNTDCITARAISWEEFLCKGQEAGHSVAPRVKYIERQFCSMSLTSGTTGERKMVVHCHESLVASLRSISHPRHMGLNNKDVLLSTATLGHSFALFGCFCKAIVQGASSVFLETTNTDGLLEALEKQKVSMLTTVPYVAGCLLDHPQRTKYDLRCLKRLMVSTNYISEDVERRLFEELKLESYVQLYAQTEIVFVAAGLQNAPPRFGSIGRLGMGVEAMVIDKTGEPLGPGQRGELLIRSQGLMRGYWGRLDEPFTDENGWFRTGDECYYDEDEWLYLVQRLSEFILCRDRKVPPAAIEAVLLKCAEVQDCAVVGLPNAEVGHMPHALVVPKRGCEDLGPQHFQRFADEKLPRSLRLEGGVTIVDTIPRNKLGKLVRRELVKWILGRRSNNGVN